MSGAQWNNIPQLLKDIPAWCVHGPTSKAPLTANGYGASVTDPETWTDFHSACMAAEAMGGGIGFVLHAGAGVTCIDLDVKDSTSGEDLAAYGKIYETFDSYTEYSKSGRGLHIWCLGEIGQGARRGGVEVYSQERFIICTGNVLNPIPMQERQALLEWFVEGIRTEQNRTSVELVESDEAESDEVIWNRATTASNADKFNELWRGDWQALGYPSQSEADLSLLSMLCFYSKSNAQVRRLFRHSGLGKREKAVKNDRYLDRTLVIIRARQEREAQFERVAQQAGDALKQQLAQQPPAPPPAGPVAVPMVPGEGTNPALNVSAAGMDYPPGMVGELARWFFAISKRPVKEVAIVSALGVCAGLFGRAYNISGSGLNLYIVLVARSAIGKEAMHSSISALSHIMLGAVPVFSDYVDFNDYASGPALVKAIGAKNSFVNVCGEWGRKLRKMSDDHAEGPMSSLRTAMTNLYQKSGAGTIVGGIGYSDKEKDVKSVNGVAYSMIGETTPDNFYESLTNTMMQDGFMSRFVIVEYGGLRPELNYETAPQIPDELYNTIANASATVASCPAGAHMDVKLSPEADAALRDFDKLCDREINSTDDESWRQMWNRAHLKALKVSALLAVADNYLAPVVTTVHTDWALDLVKRDIRIMSRKITDGDVGDGDSARERKVLSLLREYLSGPVPPGYKVSEYMRQDAVVARKYLQIRLQKVNSFVKHRLGANAALDSTLKSLCDSGYLWEMPKDKLPAEWGFQGRCFKITALPTF